MLLRGLTALVIFQLLGTLISVLLLPQLPGPILGMLLLLLYLLLRGEVSKPVGEASNALLRYLPLLLVPPATAVMLHSQVILDHFWSLAGALVISVLLSSLASGWLMQRLVERQNCKRGES